MTTHEHIFRCVEGTWRELGAGDSAPTLAEFLISRFNNRRKDAILPNVYIQRQKLHMHNLPCI